MREHLFLLVIFISAASFAESYVEKRNRLNGALDYTSNEH